jgi:hypothetical protein
MAPEVVSCAKCGPCSECGRFDFFSYKNTIIMERLSIVHIQKYILTYNIFAYFVFLYGPHLAHDTNID